METPELPMHAAALGRARKPPPCTPGCCSLRRRTCLLRRPRGMCLLCSLRCGLHHTERR